MTNKTKDMPQRISTKKSDFCCIFGRSSIDYDSLKEEKNRRDHNYSLESAVYLLERWILPVESPPLITSDSIIKNGEIRHQHMTVDDERNIVFFVTTMRAEEIIRVISLRRASEGERSTFIKITGYSKID